jgi:hypothetical protein
MIPHKVASTPRYNGWRSYVVDDATHRCEIKMRVRMSQAALRAHGDQCRRFEVPAPAVATKFKSLKSKAALES